MVQTDPEKNPDHPRALTELGELAFLSKKYEEAERPLEKGLALDPETAPGQPADRPDI